MKLYFDDTEFDAQLQRAVFKAYDRCADIGECLATAGRIAEKNRDSWYEQWLATTVHAYDGTVEEMYPIMATAALRRGYNCLIFDGPGQGSLLYEKRLYFRPDYEVVLRAVVDFAVARAEVAKIVEHPDQSAHVG